MPIFAFDTQPSSTQAGAHPDVGFNVVIGNRQTAPLDPCACHDAKDIVVHLPTGLIGNPHATPQCDIAHFSADQCPVDSQLGVQEGLLSTSPANPDELGSISFVSPVFNLVPPPGQLALFGFKTSLADTPLFVISSARTGSDYGADATVSNISHYAPLRTLKTVVWGVPAAPVHDNLRFEFGEEVPASLGGEELLCQEDGSGSTADPATVQRLCPVPSGGIPHVGLKGPVSDNSPEEPFFQNPTTCGETALFTGLDVLSYDTGETHAASPYPATTDCALLSFNPSQAIEPTTTAADSPSGAEFRLTVPQFESPSVPSPSELKAAVVTLPAGFSLAPNVTNGKETCSEAEAQMGAYASTEEGHCPENSKIGTISVSTSVLPGPLPGVAYLGEPKPGKRFRVFLLFDGFGVHVKLPGTVTPDPATGQLHISFQNLPQVPFESFNMHVFGAERGPLDTPTRCGTYEVTSEWTPWDAALADQTSRQFFTIDEGSDGASCPDGRRPFRPGFQAASAANTAGAHTSLSLNVTREDGEQELSSLTVTTPPGLAATLKGVSYCPESSIAAAALEPHLGTLEQVAPSCPASSQVGETVVGAGPGSHPLYLPGKVYLAGPYKGAPFSLVFVTPATSAGYDIGNLIVRAALRVNLETAQLTAVSDPLPQTFGGIPLRLRQILINLDRPGFALNPTNCEPFSVTAQISGDEGALSQATQHFQVANCAALPFKPRLSLRVSGRLGRNAHPALRAIFRTDPGEAAIAAATITLPSGELLDIHHIRALCARDLPPGRCPPASRLGYASLWSPALQGPLQGPIYLRVPAHRFPELLADLSGQVHVLLRGQTAAAPGGRLRFGFADLPDFPLTKALITLSGARRGIVVNSESLCAHSRSAQVALSSHSGVRRRLQPRLLLHGGC